MIIHEHAPAKVNLVLLVGPRRDDGLHELCSLFASIDLADRLEVGLEDGGEDVVVCPGVEGENLVSRALALFREAAPQARLGPGEGGDRQGDPGCGGTGGRERRRRRGPARRQPSSPTSPSPRQDLLAVAARLGSDVPSQLRPGHAIVMGGGELVEPVALQAIDMVLVPQPLGLSTGRGLRRAGPAASGRPGAPAAAARSRAAARARRPHRPSAGHRAGERPRGGGAVAAA